MLRQLHVRAKPSLLRRAAGQRHFGSTPRFSNPDYIPPPGPYFYPPPRSRASRLKDMAIGAGLTIGAFAAFAYYSNRQFLQEVMEIEEEAIQEQHLADELRLDFADARRTGDRDRLRELTFSTTRLSLDPREEWEELGPLPGLPEAKNAIPEEDTLVFISSEPEEGMLFVRVAVNAEQSEVIPIDDPESGALTELMVRLNHSAFDWIWQRKLNAEVSWVVNLIFRDIAFSYSYNPAQSS